MVSNGKHVGVGSDCYIEIADLPNTFESHEVSITNPRNLQLLAKAANAIFKIEPPVKK